VSAELSQGSPAGATHVVHVQVTFHTADERAAHTVAAKLIDRAHEIANLPECECDVDVSVEASFQARSSLAKRPSVDVSGASSSVRPSKS
jgi:hypothetical protein